VVDEGILHRVELASGLIVEMAPQNIQMKIQNLRWLEKTPMQDLAVDDKKFEDVSDDPTAGADLNELVMMGHDPTWKPGRPSGDPDGRFLNLRTGQVRRIGFEGAASVGGCFLKDRRFAVISGVDTMQGTWALCRIDLKTGENVRLGGEPLASGMSMFPVISPDGKTLAVLHKGAGEKLLESRVYLVDPQDGSADAKPLGEPMDTAFLNWLPDGKGLILVQRESKGMDKVPDSTIVRMDLAGKVVPLRKGRGPVVVGERILFEDEGRQWKTCDLSGKDEKLFADGLTKYNFPAPSPDGKRILMMKFDPQTGPRPMVLEWGASEGKPATTMDGLWSMPAWR
jgi:hypothetical protein